MAGSGTVSSPMQGTVIKLNVTAGQSVEVGEVVAVMEAMKMENPLRATVAGTVASVHAEAGQVVAAGAVIVEITPITATAVRTRRMIGRAAAPSANPTAPTVSHTGTMMSFSNSRNGSSGEATRSCST